MQELLAKVVMTVLTCAVLLSCGSTVSQREDIVAVKKVMAQRKQAIESHDLALYQQLLLPAYADHNTDYQTQVENIKSLFTRYHKIDLTYQLSPVEISGQSARVAGTISYKLNELDKPIYIHETTLFRKLNGKWYISGGVSLDKLLEGN